MDNSILDDNLTTESIDLVPASLGKRFLNSLIDGFAIMLAFSILGSIFSHALLYIAIMILYYFLLETKSNGKTLGKYATNTRVVDIDGYPPTDNSILQRTIIRFIPFESLSFLFLTPFGWHDKWSDTMVIDERLSTIPTE